MAGLFDAVNEAIGNYRYATLIKILDANYAQVFDKLYGLTLRDNPRATIMYHPIETGAQVADHRIIEPTEISIIGKAVYPDYQTLYNQIVGAFNNADEFQIQTRTTTYYGMYLVSMPTIQDAETYNGYTIQLDFKQAQFVSPQYGVLPKNPSNESTVTSGTKQTTEATAEQTAKASNDASAIQPKV